MFQVVKKLKQLQGKLKELNSQQFRNIVKEAEEDKELLKLAQELMQSDPLNVQLQEDEKTKFEKHKHSSFLAEMFLQQKCKANWIKIEDDNTKYFYSVIKHRRLQQAITQIQDNHESWRTNQDVIAISLQIAIQIYQEENIMID